MSTLTYWFEFHLQGDGISPLVQSPALGKGAKHRPPPIKLPSGSGNSSSGTAAMFDQDEWVTMWWPCVMPESRMVENRYTEKGEKSVH